jgi:hypothetical protein
MHTEGFLTPETAAAARERYETAGPAAQTVVREVATAMDFDREEYDERVTSAVVETARDAIFASQLEVRVGAREDFEDWQAANPDYETEVIGSENVDRVAWHAAPFAETAVAATFGDREAAAVGTLRRQAFGSVYRPVVSEDA